MHKIPTNDKQYKINQATRTKTRTRTTMSTKHTYTHKATIYITMFSRGSCIIGTDSVSFPSLLTFVFARGPVDREARTGDLHPTIDLRGEQLQFPRRQLGHEQLDDDLALRLEDRREAREDLRTALPPERAEDEAENTRGRRRPPHAIDRALADVDHRRCVVHLLRQHLGVRVVAVEADDVPIVVPDVEEVVVANHRRLHVEAPVGDEDGGVDVGLERRGGAPKRLARRQRFALRDVDALEVRLAGLRDLRDGA